MVARALWLWLCVGWLMTRLTEAITSTSTGSICSLDPCTCNRGKLLCDCSSSVVQEITLKAELFDSFSFSSISVANCLHVHLAKQALISLPALQQISVANVERLTLEEKALSWTTENAQHNGLLINITNSAIPVIPSYSFQGSLRDILFTAVNISRIQAFAYSSISHADKIEFNRVNFANIETQSFKKFSVEFLTFIDCQGTVFPKRTMLDLKVLQEVRLYKVKLDRVATTAFTMQDVRNFKITQSTIGYVEETAFNVLTKGDVSVHDNTFSFVERRAFAGFTVEKRYAQEGGKQDFIFENNTITNFAEGALTFNTSGFNPRLDWVMINQTCSCSSAESWATDLVLFTSDTSSTTSSPQVRLVMYCFNPRPINIGEFQKLNCGAVKSSIVLKILVITGVILGICTVAFVLFCVLKKRGKRYINVPTSPAALKPANNNKAHMLVVPDGKTYRETELHVIVEHAEPIIPTEFVKERPHRGASH